MSHVLTVGISDCVVSGDPNAVITTHALGSCVGLLIYDPVARVGGMLHYMLPDSTMDKDRALQKPFMFADTGIPLLFHTAYKAGARKERIQVTALGGAQILGTNDSFSIGKRNLMSMRKILWKAGVMLHHEEVGGTSPRTARLEIATGKILVSFGRGQHEVHQGTTERREANGL
jgi:chemotaxis protein CheD